MRARANVIDLRHRRIERLAADLARDLRAGHVIVEVDRIDSVEEWRAAARAAGRRHGWQVRTGMSRGGGRVWAARVDGEASAGSVWRPKPTVLLT